MRNITENLENFNKHKKLSLRTKLEQRYKNTPRKSKRCAECGSVLSFDVWLHKDNKETKNTLESANFCDVRWCPMCAWRKTKKLARETKSILEQLEAQRRVKYLFLTLTIKNPPLNELKKAIREMSQAFNRLTRQKEFKKSIIGFVRAIEYLGDNTKKGEAHPHFHTILAVDEKSYFGKNYINQAKWTEMWQKALRADYKPIVDIRSIRAKNDNWKDSDSAVYETLKYSVAPLALNKLTQQEFMELDKQTRGTRQYNKGGLLREIKPLPNAELDPEVWEYIKTELYTYIQQNGYEKCLEIKKDRHS